MKLYHHMHKIWLLTLLEKHKVYKLAAAEAQLTQSALSQNITNLEKVFGKPLIQRTKTGIVLTDFAKLIAAQALPILDSIDVLYNPSDELSGVVKIGAYDSLAVNFLSHIVPQLKKEFPLANFQVISGSSAELMSLVKNGSLDFGLIIDNGEDLGLEKTILKDISLGLYAHKDNSQQDIKKLIENKGIVSLSLQTSDLPSYYQSFLSDLPFSYEISMAFTSFESIRNLLLKSDNVGVLPDLLAKKSDQLVKVWDGGNSLHQHQAILTSRPIVRTEIKKMLANLLAQEMA